MDADDRRLGLVGSIVASLLGLLIGGFAGVATTLVHRQWLTPPPVTVPWGMIAGLAVIACVLAGLRIVFDSRLVAAVGAAGVLGMTALLTLEGPGGSVLVLDDWLGWTWSIAPAAIALVVLAWPRPQRPETGDSTA